MKRIVENLNQGWYFARTDEIPARPPLDWQRVDLPHTWNSRDGQDGGNDYWRGTACYVRTWKRPNMPEGTRAILSFDGAAIIADVFVNGRKAGHHEGGFSTFRIDITEDLKDDNLIAVTVNNAANHFCYPQKADFTFYGGIYRDVNLILVPSSHFALTAYGTPGLYVTARPQPDCSACVHATVWTEGTDIGDSVSFSVQPVGVWNGTAFALEEEKKNFSGRGKVKEDGTADFDLKLPQAHLWNGVKDPFLYEITAELSSGDRIRTDFGVRSFHMDPQKGFILNGASYPLRGVSRHQDRKDVGNAITSEMMTEDMNIIREIGANTVRLAHYEQAEEFYDLCDRYGIAVWNEIPFITMFMPDGRENTLEQMKELIIQRRNHPSVICWGLSNEITAAGGVSDEMIENHQALNALAHQLDPDRPTAMANVFMLDIDSPMLKIPDVNAYNLYFGWYVGDLEQNDEFFDTFHQKYPDRPIGFSEYGADANPAFHSSHPRQGDYSEEYQCVYHEHMLKMISARPYLWGTYVWNLFDFAADGRDEGGEHGLNQKGLVTFDRKLKKDAFYLYKAYWNSSEKFVHLCGKRYVNRAEEKTEIRVYSNLPSITLYVDGEKKETQTGKAVFVFHVDLPSCRDYDIRALSEEGCADEMRICRVEKADSSYMLDKTGAFNWLSEVIVNENYYSVNDKLGEIMKNKEAGKLLMDFLWKAASSRGDVATSTKSDDNSLDPSMARMTLGDLFQKAGIGKEEMEDLNNQFQKIRK